LRLSPEWSVLETEELLSMKQIQLLFGLCTTSNMLFSKVWNGKHVIATMAAMMTLAVAATPAQADMQVTSTFTNVNPGEVVGITSQSPNVSGYGWAGVYNFSNASGYLTGNYSGFCIDIAQDIYSNQTATWTVAALSSAPTPGTAMGTYKAALIGELWYQDYGSIGTSNQAAAAFQIAIWEIINETTSTLSVTGGSFTVSDSDSGTLTLANQWLSQLNLNGTGPQTSGLIALTNSTYQDYVVQGPVAPAPPGLVLGCIWGISFLVPWGWRQRKRFSFASAA
jgi:hypothetical protein